MMEQSEIREKREHIDRRLREHDAARKIIEAELLALRHICQHPNGVTTHDSGWGRMPSNDFRCPDCGLTRST